MDPRMFLEDVDFSGDIDEATYLKLKEVLRLAKVPVTEYNLGAFDGEVSLTADVLERQELTGMHRFLCISVHFIDESWILRKWAIKCCSIDDVFGVEPLDAIIKSLDEWEIRDKTSSLTLDFEYEAEEFDNIKRHVQEKKKLSLNGQLFRVNCYAECVSLVVRAAFNEIRETIFKINRLCSHKKPPLLWYVQNSNLKQALKMRYEGKFSSKAVKKRFAVPSVEEWKKVEAVCKIVDSIYNVAKGLFHKENVTTNLYLYHLDEIREILTKISNESPESFAGSVAKGRMLKYLDDYWKDTFLVLAIAAVLDPRFKMKYIEFTCSKFWGSGEASSSQVNMVADAIHELYDDYDTRFRGKAPSSSSTLENSEEGSLMVLQEYNQFIQSQGGYVKSELNRYLEEPVLPWREDFDVLNWWKKASTAEYPILSRIARDILAIPMALATADNAFYTVPRPVDERLEPICTQSWYYEG